MMSRKKKILIIIHLIFAFSLLTWVLIKPYVMEVAARKSEQALRQMVMQRETLFQSLPLQEQMEISAETGHSSSSYHIETSSFILAWIFFSIAICVLLLFRIEGAKAACWLLPLIVIAYGYGLFATPHQKPKGLFPSEGYVRENYTGEEGDLNQRERLLRGWHNYLIYEWAKETPSEEPSLFEQQLDRGLFAFNVARLKWIRDGKGDEVVISGFTSPPSHFRILSYLIWNGLFAWMINRREKVSQSDLLSSPSSSA